jgi:hypothetical protein
MSSVRFRYSACLHGILMNFIPISKADLIDTIVKTTPENVQEANEGLFNCTMTLPAAAKHCGMTKKEMKLTFFEYLKYHPPTYEQ